MIDTTGAANAVDAVFERMKAAGRLAFIPYLTAGYPDAGSTVALGKTLAAHGADLIEIGVPFSDPLGDGPTIQRSSVTALAGGMTVRGALGAASELASATGKPIVLMGYYNPILRYGLERFCADAGAGGIAGLIVPDLPVEESDDLRAQCRAHGMHLIYLLAPTSTEARIVAVAERGSGFIYCMAVTGVTGARADLAGDLSAFLQRVRARTALPLVVGFGISQPEHLQRLCGLADGAIVASALIDLMDAAPRDERETRLGAYIDQMSAACSAS